MSIPIGRAQQRVEATPTGQIEVPRASGYFHLDQAIAHALTAHGARVIEASNYAESLGGRTAKIAVERPDGSTGSYFLKIEVGPAGRGKCEGEFESLRAIHAVSPVFTPEVHAWGRCGDGPEEYFLLEEFREIGKQPAGPVKLAASLACLHQRSLSPTGKFGFHVKTCHGGIEQCVDEWDDSWAALFGRHLGHAMELATPQLDWPEFNIVCKLTLEKVVPRLLLPLQANGRTLKPSLVHGDCWDGNTAEDAATGEASVFDACSFYGHNEYDLGNWRAPRHRLSDRAYASSYHSIVPVSEPVEDWSARNLLYSLVFNIGNFINVPGSQEHQVVYEDMATLCSMFCPEDLRKSLTSYP